MDALWALSFTLTNWRERRKAELWAKVQENASPCLSETERADMDRLRRDLPRLHAEAEARGARLVLPGDASADRLLMALPYPVALWVRGTLPPALPTVSMVGSRKASAQGRERAHRWARALTQAGVVVLSGLARGIDGAAHTGALEAGPTWGIMGSGLDHPYPSEHRDLMDRMVAAGGGVITPFPPHAQPLPFHFPRRNVLLVAWADGVLLIEATLKSGSLVTAKLALDHGKELWACAGDPENPHHEGTHALLREGAARLVRSPADVAEDLLFCGQAKASP